MLAKTSGVRSDKLSDELKKAETQLRNAASLVESTRDQCFKLTDRIRNDGESAPDRLADKALASWQQEPSSPYLDDAWVTRNINQFVQVEAEHLANLIQNTAQELTAALDSAASALSTGEREDRFNLQNFVKDMPPAEFASAPVRLEKPRLLSLSAGLARRSIRNELEKRLGVTMVEFFSSYGHTLEIWLRSTLDSLAREFETHADIYRAQLQRLTARALSQADVPAERILQDESFLRQELELEEVDQRVESGATTQ
jgi:hypothetical protein